MSIQLVATMTWKKGRVTNGIYEVIIPGVGHKYLPLIELKEKAGVRSANQTSKIETWLNSEEGTKWAKEVTQARIPM